MAQPKQTRKVSDVLNVGRDRATSAAVLQSVLNLRSRRELYKMIQDERANGAIILVNYEKGGYFLPDLTNLDEKEEIEHFIYRTEKMARQTAQAAESAKEFLMSLTA